MGRAIGGVVAGFVLWTILWLGFGAAMGQVAPQAVAPGQPVTSTGVLLGYLIYSVLISAASGWLCAMVAARRTIGAVWVLGLLLLVVGVAVEIAGWALTPVWYHLLFLTFLLPATVFGGGLGARRRDPYAVAAQ